MHMLSNYCGYRKCKLILVFDAYKVKGYHGETEQYHNITVVYTKEAETADSYIEKATLDLSKKHKVRVATSDGMEQLIILGNGALRITAAEFRQEVLQTEAAIREYAAQMKQGKRPLRRSIRHKLGQCCCSSRIPEIPAEKSAVLSIVCAAEI